MKILGTVVWVIGVLLIIGNVSGAFPTFPFFGFIVTVIGVAMMKSDGGSASGGVVTPGSPRVNPAALKGAVALLEDERYKAALQMVMEDARTGGADVGGVLVRGTTYLEANGIPAAEGQRNLGLILRVLVAAKGDSAPIQPVEPVQAVPDTWVERHAKQVWRSPIIRALAAAVVIGLMIAGGMAGMHAREAGHEKAVLNDANGAYNEALAHQRVAEADMKMGGDSAGEYEKARLGYERALSMNPMHAEAANNLGCVHKSLGDAIRARGGDPSGEYEKALGAFEKALSINPRLTDSVFNQALVYEIQGSEKGKQGEDPSGEYEKAHRGYESALGIDPMHAHAAYSQALLYELEGLAKRKRGEDPSGEYEKAHSGFERALSINPVYAEAAYSQALLYRLQGLYKRARGEDPSTEYAMAISAYERTLSIDPPPLSREEQMLSILGGNTHPTNSKYAEAASGQADVYRALGDAKRVRGEDPSGDYEKALSGYEKALHVDPSMSEASRNQALVRQSLAQTPYAQACADQSQGDAKRARGEDPGEEYAKALVEYEKALSINPSYAEAATNQAIVYKTLGDAKRARGEDPRAEYEKAQAGYARALAAKPTLWQAHNGRGDLLEALGRFPEAVEAYEAAVRSVGDDAPRLEYLKTALARARGEADAPAQPPTWVAQAGDAAKAFLSGDYVTARRLYGEALIAAPDGAEKDPDLRKTLAKGHYDLACIDSLASAGNGGWRAGAKAVDKDEATHLRERAFQHLARAIDLGGCNARKLSEDADLAPLRADPRWSDLARRLRK